MKQAKFRPVLVLLVAATIITGLLWLTPAGLRDGYDLARMHQCYKSDLRTALLAGEMPWWNPFTALGRPFLADVETASLYPASWLVIPFGVDTGILIIIWLHVALVIEGVRRFARKLNVSAEFAWVAGISFALSGALLGRIQSGQLQVFCVICLWPWIWLSTVKLQDEPGTKSTVRTAFWLALSFLAGSPQILWCGLVPLGALLIVRSTSWHATMQLLFRLTAAGALAAGLTAIQLLPFIELVQQGNRPLNDVTFATRYGEPALGWLTLLVPPGLFTDLKTDGEYNLHGGILLVIFACAALPAAFRQRNVRALAAVASVGILLALGDRTFILTGLAKYVPGFSGVRYPSRYALATLLAATFLAVWWLDRAWHEKRLNRSIAITCVTFHGLILATGIFVQAGFYRVPTAPANEAHLMADLRAEGLPSDGAPPRVALPASILRANEGAQCGVSTLTGFNSPALARTWISLYLMADKPPPDFHRAEVSDAIILKLGEQKRYFGLSAVLTQPGNEVHFAPPPVPRAFLSFATSRVSNWQQAVLRVREGHDFVRETLVEQDLSLPDHVRPSEGQVHIVAFERNRIVTEYSTSETAILVLAEAWYPGWTARVNQSDKIQVIPVNGWMRGVIVPAGKNHVSFEYEPTRWWLAVFISVISTLGAFSLWRFSVDRTPRQLAGLSSIH